MGILDWLSEPLTRELDLDDPKTTSLRVEIIRKKTFLRRIYQEWYATLASSLPPVAGSVLELGSGAGFLRESIPGLITSEVFSVPGIDLVCKGQQLPFLTGSLRAVVMVDVLHHIPGIEEFFDDAARCVKPTGRIAMIEPWVTPWSKFIYQHFHHEPFDPAAERWDFPETGPLSGANGALPWIVFKRDRQRFEDRFPQWEVSSIQPMMPFRYLLCGGLSKRSLVPANSFHFWRRFEDRLSWQMKYTAMFAKIVMVRR